MRKKVGLYFGTFNPVHIGHLIIAQAMKDYASLDEVWFVISPQSPFKQDLSLLAVSQRIEMLQLAIQGNPSFHICEIELSLPKPSYTIHTLRCLQSLYADYSFGIIMGSDNLVGIGGWKDAEIIRKQYPLYIYPRRGFVKAERKEEGVYFFDQLPLLDLSSTYIRESIQENRSVRYLLPERVYEYVEKMQIYRKRDFV